MPPKSRVFSLGNILRGSLHGCPLEDEECALDGLTKVLGLESWEERLRWLRKHSAGSMGGGVGFAKIFSEGKDSQGFNVWRGRT